MWICGGSFALDILLGDVSGGNETSETRWIEISETTTLD